MAGKRPPYLAVDVAGSNGSTMLIDQSSLSETVDAVNDAVFFGKAMAAKDRRHVARWIAARQGLPGAYGSSLRDFRGN